MLDGNAEALFTAVDVFSRQEPFHGLFKNPFGLQSLELVFSWKLKGKLHNLMVKERNSRFQRDSHAHPVDLNQDIIGKISF